MAYPFAENALGITCRDKKMGELQATLPTSGCIYLTEYGIDVIRGETPNENFFESSYPLSFFPSS